MTEPILLGYDGDSFNNTEVEPNPPMRDNDFIQSCDTYGTYMALDNLDHIVDIVNRCNPFQDDPEEIHQALQEILRLAQEAVRWGEMTTEDRDEDDEDRDDLSGLFYDRGDRDE